MAASEVATLGSIVVLIASKILDLGNSCYKASDSWKDFPRKVRLLRRKYDFWQAEFKTFGLISDKALIETLREAKLLLEKEQSKLLRKVEKGSTQCAVCSCWPNSCAKLAFPAKLGQSVQNLINAFDDIPGFLRAEEEAGRKPLSPPVYKDDRYVPFTLSEREIYSALDNPEGPALVLLHGGPGKGKSTLAKRVALHYKESSTGKESSGDMPVLFEHVIYLECGTQANTLAKQFELLQPLGSDTVTAAPHEQGHSGPDFTIPKRLLGLLKDEKLLIILDDVWEEEFLQRMVDLFGGKVKCLVTSQLGKLCSGVNFKSVDILIEDIQQEDARKILASHLRSHSRHIPQHLEGLADKIIHETEANPLVLASIATAAGDSKPQSPDDKRPDELGVWEAASKDYFQFLDIENSKNIYKEKYPRGFWAAMRFSLEHLKEEEKTLLILMNMCQGPSVPEEVIHFLYRSTKPQQNDFAAFAKLRKELERRNLVKVTLVSDISGKWRSWSAHSLQKQYIEEEMANRREPTFTSLEAQWDSEANVKPEIVGELAGEGEEAIVLTLGALYLSKQFATRAASTMGIRFDRCKDLRRNAIQPITRLLDRPVSERWPEALRSSARQVFLRYICNGVLHDGGISDLLSSPASALAMLGALKDIALIEKHTLLNENTQGLIKVLVSLIGDVDGVDASVREATGKALFYLCDMNNTFIVSKSPSVLDAVVRVQLSDSLPKMHVLSTWILANLSRSREVGAPEIVVEYPGVLGELVQSLSKEDNPSLPVGAAWALGNVASGNAETKSKIVNCPQALEELVKSLSMDNSLDLQYYAAIALANLAGGDGEKKLKIVSCPDALEKLVKSLSKDGNPDLQRHSARSLASLAAGDSETKLKIFDVPGALNELVKSLFKDNIPYLQKHAARALANLAAGDSDKKLKIVSSPGAVEELVKSLSKGHNSDLQEHAARALANLAAGDAEKKLKIVNIPGATEALANLLSNDNNPELQEHAAIALANLAGGDGEKKLIIANSPGAIEQLVKSLSKDNNPDLQRHAARALASLAAGDGGTKLKITTYPGALEELTKSSSKDSNPYLEKYATKALANLTGDPRRKSLARRVSLESTI